MPCYEYECIKCGDRFEFLHLGKDDIAKCEKCGTKRVKKLPSSFGFGFKGFGAPSVSQGEPAAMPGKEQESAQGGCGCSSVSCGCSS